MELNLNQNIKNMLLISMMILLPLILIGIGALFGFINVGYYILLILWFGMGVTFFAALN